MTRDDAIFAARERIRNALHRRRIAVIHHDMFKLVIAWPELGECTEQEMCAALGLTVEAYGTQWTICRNLALDVLERGHWSSVGETLVAPTSSDFPAARDRIAEARQHRRVTRVAHLEMLLLAWNGVHEPGRYVAQRRSDYARAGPRNGQR